MERVRRIDSETRMGLADPPLMISLTAASPTYQMKPSDTVVIVDTTSAGDDGVAKITLPSLAESVGKFYYIKAPVGATGGDLSVLDKESATEITTYGDMDADGDDAIFFSTGLAWITVYDGVA